MPTGYYGKMKKRKRIDMVMMMMMIWYYANDPTSGRRY
jgi:hypothetical protein